jgi:hypothetical protein
MKTRASVVLSIAVLMAGLAVMTTPTLAQRGGGGRGGGAPRVAPNLPPAGPVPRTPDGKPNMEGVFSGMGRGLTNTVILEEHTSGFGIQGGPSLIIDPPTGIIPYQPWALVERNKRREDVNAYEDPVGHCEFYDIGRLHSFAQRFIYLTDGNIAIAGQEQVVRIINMNRREHLPASIRLWNGDPIGRWEGDTLVIDTTNFNGRTRMALGGDFYSANAHVVERYTMTDSNTINWTMTITDPTVFTRPWTMRTAAPMIRQVENSNDWNRALRLLDPSWEHDCHEGNVVLRHMRNVYDKAYGGKWREQTVPGSVPAAAP